MSTVETSWEVWDDFTPGIYARQFQGSYSNGAAYPEGAKTPKGACQWLGSWGFVALPSGSIAPAPGRTVPIHWPTLTFGTGANVDYPVIAGFYVQHAVGLSAMAADNNVDEVHVLLHHAANAGANDELEWWKLDVTWDRLTGAITFGSWQLVWSSGTAGSYNSSDYNTPMLQSRMNPNSPFLTAGVPVLVAAIESNTLNELMVYPSPSAPGAIGTLAFAAGAAGIPFLFQNRIGVFRIGGEAFGDKQLFNDKISYTDPPNSSTWPDQQVIFVPEDAVGYAAVDEVNAGELLVIKRYGGGALITGDLNNPVVTRLPNLTPVGFQYVLGTPSPIGYIYPTFWGVWVWNGGATSRKISENLADQVFRGFTTPGTQNQPAWVKHQISMWGKYAYLQPGLLYDTELDGWYPLDDPYNFAAALTGNTFPFWSSPVGEGLIVAPNWSPKQANVMNNTTPMMAYYNPESPVHQYQWKSHPFTPDRKEIDQDLNIREVIVDYSCYPGAGGGTIQFTFDDINVGSQTVTVTVPDMTLPNVDIKRVRASINVISPTIQFTMLVTGGGGTGVAPTIHGVAIGWISSSSLVPAA